MSSTTYTKQQRNDARLLYAAVRSNPPDKQAIVKVMANTFINGMNAQERLMENLPQTASKSSA